jgi:thiamine-monophosphate kinase
MSNIGEFDLIERISAQFRDYQANGAGTLGIGDDCAVLPQREGLDTLVTTDLLIEERHFLLSDISPWQLGWKSAAVNISDIAAMGGRPEATFLSIALPKKFPSKVRSSGAECADAVPLADWVDEFIGGFKALSDRFGVPLLGGDTSASPDKLFINVTVLGSCPHGAAILRSGAKAGDLVCVTGPLGDAGAGLKLILDRAASPDGSDASGGQASCHSERSRGIFSLQEQTLIRRHYEPVPRVAEGIALRECGGVHAMMDISDGIASDLRHILKASESGQTGGEGAGVASESGQTGGEGAGVASESGQNGGQASSEVQFQAPPAAKTAQNAVGGPMSGTSGDTLGAIIDLKSLPLSDELRRVCSARGWDPYELAVSGGEDYELLFTIAPEALEEVRKALASLHAQAEAGTSAAPSSAPTEAAPSLTVIGRITKGPGIRWEGGLHKDYQGFTHF